MFKRRIALLIRHWVLLFKLYILIFSKECEPALNINYNQKVFSVRLATCAFEAAYAFFIQCVFKHFSLILHLTLYC